MILTTTDIRCDQKSNSKITLEISGGFFGMMPPYLFFRTSSYEKHKLESNVYSSTTILIQTISICTSPAVDKTLHENTKASRKAKI